MDQNNDYTTGFDGMNDCDSIEHFKEYIIERTRDLLKEHFSDNPAKQKIKVYRDRISFACPYCDDSQSDNKKKRGNLIFQKKFANSYKCFNCGKYTSIQQFFKNYNKDLRLSSINYISTVPFQTQNRESNIEISFLYDTSEVESLSISKPDLMNHYGFINIENTIGVQYLNSRWIYDMKHFLFSPFDNSIVILNQTFDGNIIGFQKRTLNQYTKNKYLTFKLSKIYDDMGLDSGMVSDEADLVSGIFFIYFIDWSMPVTILEGPLDSLLFPNSVGMAGVHKTLPFDTANFRYLLDFDDAGTKVGIEKLKDGNSVFMWRNFLTSIGYPVLTIGHNKKMDLTDLITYCSKNNIYITPKTMEEYFSDSYLMGMLGL